MTRIGGTLAGADLIALASINRNFQSVNESSRRLATLSRINRGSDDPSGLIAAEALSAELAALEAASTNASRARSFIHVADSGLGQVSSLLNQVRGNLIEAAGDTASPAARAALQLEIDSALEAIDRIGRTTALGGRKLLDGSAGYQVASANEQQIAAAQVNRLSGTNPVVLDIEVLQAAQGATLQATAAAVPLDEELVLRVQGGEGTVLLEFSAGATLKDVAQAIHASSAATGVDATADGASVTIATTSVGSDSQVTLEVVSGSLDLSATTAAGSDAVVLVNGQAADASGNDVHFSSELVDVEFTLAPGMEGELDSLVLGGAALSFVFSSSPGEVSRLALPAVDSAHLGGADGRLSELLTGGSASLDSGDLGRALSIVDAARGQVLDARARAGSFERFTIDTASEVLSSTIINVSEARSQIRDTDVALETARLVQSLILTDASILSASVANSRRGIVSELLR